MRSRISLSDLTHMASSLEDVIPHIRDSRIFITGGTGFFGKWLLEAILFLNEKQCTNFEVVVLTRDPEKFKTKHPHFANRAIEYITGDIKNFDFPSGEFHYCIHAALEGEKLDKSDELEIFESAYNGTKRVLEFAVQKKMRSLLYVSSGGVYGRQPPALRFMPEDYMGAPDITQLRSCYGEGKRAGEFLCTYYGNKFALPVKIARCFAFIGPYLALDAHFAIGNLLNNCLKKEPMLIKGNGTPIRSYMYAADLAVSLFKTLILGDNLIPYNVGSMEEISIAALAQKIGANFTPQPEIVIMQKIQADPLPERYVPDTERFTAKFPATSTIGLDEAIKKTITFNQEE